MSSDITRTVFLDGGDERLELQRYTLRVTEGPNKGTCETFEGRKATIGASPDNALSLDDAAVSRFHAEIEVSPAGYVLRDLGSKNGTFVGNLRVREVYLAPGQSFRVGGTTLQFDTTGDRVEVRISGKDKFGSMIGKSVQMREIFALLERVAATDFTVLVEGESGTGKELVADAVHRHSKRKDGPFVVVDCSSIPRDLIESELFGHIKGAFTGATGPRKGAFEAARGGTLFLDELGELPIDLQPKLLRALENKEIKPVGSNDVIKTDVRIVAATNRTLLHEVRAGNFREDLYYRFAVIKVVLPPLRERVEDIPLLVEAFLKQANAMAGREGVDVSYRTMEKLKRHKWPGNVRELKNFIERAVVLSQGDVIETKFLNAGDLSPTRHAQADGIDAVAASVSEGLLRQAIEQELPFKDVKSKLIEDFEIAYWRHLLERTNGNISKAARIAGVHRKSVEYILKKLDLTRENIGI
jgi:DNA-binding NtrC family response regulator